MKEEKSSSVIEPIDKTQFQTQENNDGNIVNGKKEILEYYNTECDKVVETINTYIEMGMYDEALNELNAVPHIDAELDCYKESLDILSKISAEQQLKSNGNIKNEVPDVSWINE